MARSFTPDLIELHQRADRDGPPVLRVWTTLSQAVGLSQTLFPDEEALLFALRGDFESQALNTLFLLGPPEPLKKVRDRFAIVMRAPEAHVLAVSKEQHDEIVRVLAPELRLKLDIEREVRSLERGIQRRYDELKAIDGWLDELENHMNALNLKEMVNLLMGGRPSARGQNSASERLQLLAKRKIDQIPSVIQTMVEMEDKQEVLQSRLERIKLCESKLSVLKARLEEAGITLTPPKVTLPAREEMKPAPSSPGAPYLGRARASKKENPPSPIKGELETSKDQFEFTLQRLREAIQLGNDVGSLRLMIPSDGPIRQNLDQPWSELLTRLGFNGKLIVAPSYESLARGEAPIVMARRMHTHTDRWKRTSKARLFVIDFAHPKLLLNYLNGGSSLKNK